MDLHLVMQPWYVISAPSKIPNDKQIDRGHRRSANGGNLNLIALDFTCIDGMLNGKFMHLLLILQSTCVRLSLTNLFYSVQYTRSPR